MTINSRNAIPALFAIPSDNTMMTQFNMNSARKVHTAALRYVQPGEQQYAAGRYKYALLMCDSIICVFMTSVDGMETPTDLLERNSTEK